MNHCPKKTGTPNSSSILINWIAPTGAASYIVERSANGSTGWTSVGTTTGNSFINTSLSAATTYYYRILAVNHGGNSDFSATVSATTYTLTSITASTNSPQYGTQITTTLLPSGATVTYRWVRITTSGTETTISGATSANYTPTENDIGCYLKVVATGIGSHTGKVEYRLANTVKRALTSITASTNSPQLGMPISTTLLPDKATVTYQWYRGTTAGNVTTTISGATSANYTPTDNDIGCYLKVVATGTGNYTGPVNYTLTNVVVRPTTVTVTKTDSSGAGSLKQAITDIADGGTIFFANSLAGKTISLTGTQLVISKSLTINATSIYNAATKTPGITISGNNTLRVFNITGSTSHVSLIALTITGGNIASNGGGICSAGTLTVINSVISGNFASYGNGGGIYSTGTLTVTNSTISGNSASTDNGGGIYSTGTLTVTNSTISGNSASTGNGGGIYTAGTLTIANSMINGNSASLGGGIYTSGTVTTTNSTISGNAASSGGGIENSGTLTITNSTISGNYANIGEGGGIENFAGTTTLYNTIIAKNSTDIYRSSGTVIGWNNLIGNGTNSGLTNGTNGNIVGSSAAPIDPVFEKIPVTIGASNTGLNYNSANWDLRLRVTSPAINQGENTWAKYPDGSSILYDLDGNDRIFGEFVDIGAYEYQSVVPVLSTPILNAPTAISTNGLLLSWNTVINANNYTLRYRKVGDTTWITISSVTSPRSITGLMAGMQYEFQLKAVGNGITYSDSNWSNNHQVWTLCPQPTGVSATAQSTSSIKIDWTAMIGATSYLVERSANGSTGWTSVGTPMSNSYTNTGLSVSTTYYGVPVFFGQ